MRPRGATNIAKTVKNAEAHFTLRVYRTRVAINDYFENDMLIISLVFFFSFFFLNQLNFML